MVTKIAAWMRDTGSVGTLKPTDPGAITALIIDSPLQRVNTVKGTSRATTHLISSLRVSRAGRSIRELIDVDMGTSPRFQQGKFTITNHSCVLYTFSGARWPRRPE